MTTENTQTRPSYSSTPYVAFVKITTSYWGHEIAIEADSAEDAMLQLNLAKDAIDKRRAKEMNNG